ncbi:hypothetical protein ACTA71_003728 [Dictyostelium dimigraforme]
MITIVQVIEYNHNFLFNASDQNVQAILSLPFYPSQLFIHDSTKCPYSTPICDINGHKLPIISMFMPIYASTSSSSFDTNSAMKTINYSTTSNGNSLLVLVDTTSTSNALKFKVIKSSMIGERKLTLSPIHWKAQSLKRKRKRQSWIEIQPQMYMSNSGMVIDSNIQWVKEINFNIWEFGEINTLENSSLDYNHRDGFKKYSFDFNEEQTNPNYYPSV